MSFLMQMLCLTVFVSLCSGCFIGPQIRYVVDVKTPIDRKQSEVHKKQDSGHPQVGKIRPEVKIKKGE